MRFNVSDINSNFEENLQRWARSLGVGEIKRRIFETIYSNRKAKWSVTELVTKTGLDSKRIASVGKQMSVSGLFEQLDGTRVVYQKIPEVHHNKKRILSLAGNVKERENLPTKRNSGRSRVTHMQKTTNNFNHVGLANTGTISGTATGTSQSIEMNETAGQLLAALDKFKSGVRRDLSLMPEQREDATSAASVMEEEIAKSLKDRSMSKVRNAVTVLRNLAAGTEAVHKLYEVLNPLISAHFHLPA